jgi:hypothetical protein
MPASKNFGIGTTALSNATGPLQSGPDLGQLLAQLGTQPAIEANQLQGAIGELQGQQTPGMLERLMGPAGLILAAGSLLAGSEGGGLGAAAFGLGGLKGLQAQETLEREQQAKAIEQLQDQRDTALDRVSAIQQRVNNVFNTNPEAFIDPETGEPVASPEMLGLLATGFPVRLFPQSRRKLARATASREARHKLYETALDSAESIPDARQIVRSMMHNIEWFDAPDGVVDAMARAMGTPEWTPTLANIIATNATNAPDVFTRAAELQVPLEDWQIISMIDWRGEEAELPTDAENKLMLIMRYNDWMQKNPELAQKARQESVSDSEFYRSTMDQAFAEEPGSSQQLKVFLKVDENEATQFLQGYDEFSKQHELATSLSGYDELPAIRDMTDEERARYFARGAIEVNKAKRAETLEEQAKQDAAWRSKIQSQIKAEFPTLGPKSIINITNEMHERARKASLTASGFIDRQKFEDAMQAEMAKMRQDMQ